METAIELDKGNREEYEVEAICDSVVYAREWEGHLPVLHYMVSWKSYPEKENTWEPVLTVLHLCKFISTFHRDHLDKPPATFPLIDSAVLIARPTVRLIEVSSTKQKRDRPAKTNGTLKRVELQFFISFLALS